MTNPFYTPSGAPSTSSHGASASMRAEFVKIGEGFDKFPTLTGNAGKAIRVNAGETGLEATNTLTLSGGLEGTPIGQVTAAAGSFTTGSFSGLVTGSAGASITGDFKVIRSGVATQFVTQEFDGGQLTITAEDSATASYPPIRIHQKSTAGTINSLEFGATGAAVFGRSITVTGDDSTFTAASTGQETLILNSFGDNLSADIQVWQRPDAAVKARLRYDQSGFVKFGTTTSHSLVLQTAGVDALSITSGQSSTFSGHLGVNGNAAANAALEVDRSTGEIFRADAAAGAFRIIANQTGVSLGGTTTISDVLAFTNGSPTTVAGSFYQSGNYLCARAGTSGFRIWDDTASTNQFDIAADGLITVSNRILVDHSNSGTEGFYTRPMHASYTSWAYRTDVTRAANAAYHFFGAFSSGSSDLEFDLRGDGNAYADGTWNGGGADYAENFEWQPAFVSSDPKHGVSVVLDGGMLRPANDGEIPFAVVSANPSVVGDSAMRWHGKYLRTVYGNYALDRRGERVLNPDYDPNQDWVAREERDEWGIAGLVGKLRVNKNSVIAPNWIKMRDISANVSEYFIFPADAHLYGRVCEVEEKVVSFKTWQDAREQEIAGLRSKVEALETQVADLEAKVA